MGSRVAYVGSETGKQSARAAPGFAAQSTRASRAAHPRALEITGLNTSLRMKTMTLRARAIAGVFGLHASARSRSLTGALERLARPDARAGGRATAGGGTWRVP